MPLSICQRGVARAKAKAQVVVVWGVERGFEVWVIVPSGEQVCCECVGENGWCGVGGSGVGVGAAGATRGSRGAWGG